ncbi:putative GTP-binding protein 6 isoform X2 [Eubalaena glacialis]|uniref:putative GTP-binding protein 6 isoform X2 n=1 Tax=Eubalaena glacialis TaxID=27606 RepID=UPI002A5ACDCA|nr:putative GTP-binding protein 6 isoform X2 [Eubalaena glacialis]XP_061035595.1 putative GTP-binding protein 6 isoform X2 [Eubalaena glacialis]XP_061035749.1 putative GTP-binding protein 6 isoform X2 [Eubalaena glacialis]
MWALRAAVRSGHWFSRVVRGCRAPRASPPLPPCPVCALATFRGGLGGPEGRGPRADGRRSRTGGKEDEEEPEDAEEEEEEEEELLRRDPLLPAGTQRVCLVHPDVKWGPGKPQGTRAEWQVVEAQALVHTLDGWSVVDTMVVPTKTPDRKLIFGRGTLEHLTGESFLQVQQRLLKDKEAKIRKALDKLRRKRLLLGQQRRRREFPVVSVVGYTNCGKTTLIKALTGDAAIQPRDQLFATLDVTAHAGWLPSRLTVIYMDTIGFLSQLPHSLVESFSATLEDVRHSDLVVHVRDVSHPETELQKASVLSALRALQLPRPLLDHMVEVLNKVDLVPGYRPAEPNAVAVSALLGLGLEELKARLEGAVLRATGRRVLTLRVGLAGPQLSWLHQEATVQAVDVRPEAGVADVKVIISDSAYGRFRKLFPG